MEESSETSAGSQPQTERGIGTPTVHESSNLRITTTLFNGQNYLSWSRSAILSLKERGKLGYVNGTITAPPVTDSGYGKWDIENSHVINRLVHSMVPSIGEGYLHLTTAKDIWDALADTYSRKGNMAQIFDLKRIIERQNQDEKAVLQYFTSLTGLWQTFDHYQDWNPICAADIASYQKLVERDRIFKFLAGLNQEYDPIRCRVLGMEPLPSLRETFAYVQNEESRRMSMLSTVTHDRSALISTPQHNGWNQPRNSSTDRLSDEKDKLFCDYCQRTRHTRETCWKLNGGRGNRGRGGRSGQSGGRNYGGRGGGSRAHHTEIVDSTTTSDLTPSSSESFSSAEMETLRRFMSRLDTSTGASSSFAHSGNIATSVSAFHSQSRIPWVIDSGASDHMTGVSSVFSTYTPYSGQDRVKIADGTFSSVSGKGLVHASPSLPLSTVFHVPSFSTNLLSISKITQDLNCSVSFFPSHCVFQDLITGKTIGSGRKENGLYVLDLGVDSSKHHQQAHLTSLSDSSTEKILLWHHRLGHPSFYLLQHLFPSLLANKNVSTLKCESCELGKHHRASFYPSINKSIIPFTLIHTDVWGPSRVASLKGHRWFVSFVDDCSRTTWVYLMKDKSEVHAIFKEFHKMICTQYGALVKIVRSDNGGEYFKGGLTTHFLDHGIIHQSSCTNTPQQNGVAERKNRHLLEMARTMCFLMQVPKSFWGEAVLTAAYLINRLPTRVLNKRAPVEVLSGSSTLFSIPPRVFGCTGFVHNHSPSREKLDPRAIKCVFVGYSPTQKGYKCYHPPSRKWFVSMDVTFFEHQSYFQSPSPLQGESTNTGVEVVPEPEMSMFNLPVSNSFEILGTLETNDEQKEILVEPMGDEIEKENQNKEKDILYQRRTWKPRDKTILPDLPLQSHSLDKGSGTSIFSSSPKSISECDDLDVPIATRKGVRSCTQHPISKFVSYSRLSPSHNVFVSKLASVSVPNNVQEALTDPEWKHAMLEEMKALHKNNTWEVVEIPKGHKTVGCKWVFTVKHKADGSIERYKARLVAKGYTQTYGIDYQETFAPVAKMNTVRILLSLAANQNWQLHQFDVKNAFLHGNLEEEVYMSIPPGFEDPKTVGKVCKLKKSLYGLKQSPRAWFERFTQAMLKYGFKQSQGDHTLFIRHSSHGKLTALIVYVDDIVLTGDDVEEMQLLKGYLAKEFEIKDLGNLKYFLGIEVARSSQGIFISQRKYVLDLLTETGMLGSKACDTPMEPNKKLGDDTDGEMVDRGRYQRLVGKLIYLSHTRPDIAFAVSVVSQFMHAPYTTHYDAVIRILRYLKSAPGKGLFFGRHDHIQVEAYTDADWAGSVSDRKSTSGYCVMVGGNLVTWRSKKQAVVSRSSAEAEFRAMSQGICELIWIKILLRDLKLGTPETMRLYCDNKAAISIAHNPVQHDRTKHVEIDRHFIKEKLNSGVICTPFVKTSEQLADIFTKGLGSRPHHFILNKLGMRDIFAPA